MGAVLLMFAGVALLCAFVYGIAWVARHDPLHPEWVEIAINLAGTALFALLVYAAIAYS